MIVDVRDAAAPVIVATGPYLGAFGIAVRGRWVYAAGSALTVLDVSDPHAPQLVASITAPQEFRAIDVTDPNHPVVFGSAGLEQLSWRVTHTGGSMWIAARSQGIALVPLQCE